MNRYNQTGGSNAFLMMFSRASMVAAMMRGGAGVLACALAGEEVAGAMTIARVGGARGELR